MLGKIIILVFAFLLMPLEVYANTTTFSITPPLIKNNIDPGSVWQSEVKIVNNNSEEVEVFVSVQDFESGSTAGTVKFLPGTNDPEADKYLLSRWIELVEESVIVPGFKSVKIPFLVNIPESASPGGHYAAILVGTQPDNAKKDGGATMSISTKLSSLILLNVNGETIEEGYIRQFSTSESFYKKPDVDFEVVFENTGNVHIQPQGEIRVYNLFSKDSGGVTINQSSEFGNVLPGGKREWSFNWKGEEGILDMGRYKAELILGYGQDERKTDNKYIYFWILDFKVIAYIVGPIVVFFLAIFIFVKLSIRKAIRESKKMVGYVEPKSSEIKTKKGKHIVNLKEE